MLQKFMVPPNAPDTGADLQPVAQASLSGGMDDGRVCTERMPKMSAPARLLLCFALVLGLAVIPAALAAPVTAQSCIDLVVNGGFETVGAWELGPNPVTPQYVTFTKHSGNQSLMLGITSGANVHSFSSARQTVTIPASATQTTLTFWFYAMASSPATTDYMEVVLLDAAGAILTKPWVSHNNSQLWNQLSFDLSAWRGQTVQLYFNVYNDGLGGTAAMFVDDVSLVTCTGSVTVVPTGVITLVPTWTPSPTATPSGTPAPACVNAIVNGDFTGGLASWQQIGDPGGVVPVTNPVHSPPWAIQLGSLTVNLNGLASIRQSVTIPVGFSQATLGVWVYTLSQPGAGADFQQVALLNSAGNPVFVPWQAQSNNPAWTQLLFDVSGFAGQTLFVSFSVNNDGVGGRTAMVVDDARLLSCNATPAPWATPTPTRTPTPWLLPTPMTAVPPIITLTPPPPGCFDLLQNGGFETGWSPWIVPWNPIMPQLVTAPVFSGAFALQLGSQTQNASSYSSARQWVTVPWSHPRVVLQFWANTWAESLRGEDRQQVVLLAPGDTVMAVPWKVLENTRTWLPHSFDLIGVAGQTFAVYFNVINDGAGGRTAMFVDDARLWACTSSAFPPPMPMPMPVAAPAAEPDAAPAAVSVVTSAPPSVEVVALDPALGALTSGTTALLAIATPLASVAPQALASVVNVTRVAVVQPMQSFVSTPVITPASAPLTAKFNPLGRIDRQEAIRVALIAAAIIIVGLIGWWLLRRWSGRTH
jgi:hypothetical protein